VRSLADSLFSTHIAALIVAVLCIAAYRVSSFVQKRKFHPETLAECFFTGAGFWGGIKIIFTGFNGEIEELISKKATGVAPHIFTEDVVAFVFGGIALSYLSAALIYKRCFPPPEEQDSAISG
jgi:hypothetical protein